MVTDCRVRGKLTRTRLDVIIWHRIIRREGGTVVNVRLGPLDVARVDLLRSHFDRLEPIGLEISNVDIVRAALRTTCAKAGRGCDQYRSREESRS